MKVYRMQLFLMGLVSAALALVLIACGSDAPAATATPAPTLAPGQTPVATPTPSFDAEAYFRGKTIRIMTSSNPGGGTDTQMRYLASVLSRWIPGNPRIIASNVPPHVVGKNFIYQSRPDGLTMGLFSTSMLREERFPGATYNAAELTYIADVGVNTSVVVTRGNLGYNSILDMAGASGPTLRTFADASDPGSLESLMLAQMFIADALDIPFEVIRTAERGAGPAMLALERGDINWYNFGGGAWFLLTTVREGWIKSGYVMPTVLISTGGEFTPNSETPEQNFPHAYDLLPESLIEQYIGLTEAPRNMDRPLVMPPGVPAEVYQALSAALHTAWQDEEFCAGWERISGAPCVWTPGEELARRAIEGREAMYAWADQYDVVAARLYNKFVR